MAVRADQGFARNAKALQVHLVANAVARAGEVNAMLLRHGLNVSVVVGVLKAGLQGVVVDVRHGAFGFDPIDPHSLEFQVRHGTGCVLRKGLVNFQPNFLSGDHLTLDQVGFDQFLCKCKTHCSKNLLSCSKNCQTPFYNKSAAMSIRIKI